VTKKGSKNDQSPHFLIQGERVTSGGGVGYPEGNQGMQGRLSSERNRRSAATEITVIRYRLENGDLGGERLGAAQGCEKEGQQF